MKTSNRPILFVCSGSCSADRLSHRLATELVRMNLAELGDASVIFNHENFLLYKSRKMIFLNDCPVACIKELIERYGLASYQYLYLDLVGYNSNEEFNIDEFLKQDFFQEAIKEVY